MVPIMMPRVPASAVMVQWKPRTEVLVAKDYTSPLKHLFEAER